MYDAIVVGARCAGSPTAMLLARRGHHVLLVDRAAFPSDTLSTHFIHLPGIARLKRWGLLEKVVASGCPAVRSMKLDVGEFALHGAPTPIEGVDAAYGPRRSVLDDILVDGARDAGADVRERFAVTELCRDGDRVVGIVGHEEGRPSVREQARIVIGADGLRSMVARSVDAPVYEARPTLTCAYYSYWSGVETGAAELYSRPDRMIVAFPTHDDHTLVIVYWPSSRFPEVRSDVERHFGESLDLAPDLARRVRGGRRVERFRGTADLPNFYRKPYGEGWALVGDAGYHRDPITAFGISDAFRDAELLSESLDGALSGRLPFSEALADYERRRNEASRPLFDLTCQFASLGPPPEPMQQLFAAMREDQERTNRFFGMCVGTVPVREFFAPA